MKPNDRIGCHHRKLVLAEDCRVEQCSSRGTVYLTLGSVTMRFDSQSFVRVATALHAAANRVELEGDASTRTHLLC